MDCRPKSLPGTIRRRKRKRTQPSRQQVSVVKLLVSVMVLLTGLAWTIGLLWFSLSMNMQEHKVSTDTEVPPPLYLNLWPDDKSASDLQPLLMECPGCDVAKSLRDRTDKPERVLIVRPPGSFGLILSEFVETYLEGSEMEVVSSTAPLSAPFPDDDYDAVIHVVTLPLLLEAFDVLLTAAEPTKALLTADDVLAVVQHLIKWHCRVANHLHRTRSVVLTLDPTMSFPLRSEKKLEFLYNQTDIPLERDEFAKKMMEHIDEGTAFWKALLAKGSSLRSKESNLPDRANTLIQEAMKDGICPETLPALSSRWFFMSSPLETLLDSLWETTVFNEATDDEN